MAEQRLLPAEARTPDGAERLRLAYLAADQDERLAFCKWLEGFESEAAVVRRAMAPWPRKPPPDVRHPEPRMPSGFYWSYY